MARDGRPAAPLLSIDAPVLRIPGVGPSRAAQLAAAGVATVGDLLHHLPIRYEDRRGVEPIGSALARAGEVVAVVGELVEVRSQRLFRRRATLSRATVRDDSGVLRALWFNRPYLDRQVAPATLYLVVGPLRVGKQGPELVNPTLERWTGEPPGGPSPVYGRLGELGPAAVRRWIAAALDRTALDDADPLPEPLLRRRGLPRLGDALRELHRPSADAELAPLGERRSSAHRRLAYGELLVLQLRLAQRRERYRRERKPHRYRIDEEVRGLARDALPFRLTAAQRRATKEIVDDLRAHSPMTRLLQGDVGSGKTVVAALAMLVALASGHQVAFMAPTELLAEQHRRGLENLLGGRFPVGLLTRSSPERAEVSRRAASGQAMVVVGTHALLEDAVALPRLAFVVIDEQHRFGVRQRARLASKGRRPDVLVMTATPIPRSLALVLYGDLDLSVLDELPPGRREVTTSVLSAAQREDVLAAVRRHRDRGGQVYVVLPRIDGGDGSGPAVEDVGRWYLECLSDCRGAILTGRTPAEERDRLMRRMLARDLDLLVATSVIEVGVDVPAATLMVIEGAERFGLSQLHQLRGRVGRGSAPAECLAVLGEAAPQARARVELFARCADGFRIAEADLELRGPGELLGARQSGLGRLLALDALRDPELLRAARSDARELVERLDPEPLHALLGRSRSGSAPSPLRTASA